MKKSHTLALTLFLLPLFAYAQDDLLGELEKTTSAPAYIAQTFKGSRLVNGHTVDTTGAGTQEFKFAKPFGTLKGGSNELFGLD